MHTEEIKNRIIIETGEDRLSQFVARHGECSLTPDKKSVLTDVMGKSEFVFRQIMQHPQWVPQLLENNELPMTTDGFTQQFDALPAEADEATLHRHLRLMRHFYMSKIAVRDLTNQQPIDVSLKQVSALADALILTAYHTLYEQHCRQFGTPQGSHGPQPMLILGMGKLGGCELNFSSDIDLIFVYPEKGETEGGRRKLEHQQFFIKLAQKLITALNKITADGQVFRVDMRLRPFGDSGPLVMHMAAFEDYYQEQGRHWERFAMIKARVLNPASPYREEVENILKPFTFRRYLDFTTIDSLRDMKHLIASEQRRRQLGENIKLGNGGIREIEFFAQSFQLIHGGREPALQVKGLKDTLTAIHTLSLASRDDMTALYQHYLFLRKTEHTLQQINDEQTQLLPEENLRKTILAAVLGYADYASFSDALSDVRHNVNQMFQDIIETPQDSHDDDDSTYLRCCDGWHLTLSESEFCELLVPPLSQDEASGVFHSLAGFRENLTKSRLGQRGADSLNRLMPEVIYSLVEQHPSKTKQVLDRLLNVVLAVAGRTTYLDLLLENPDVLNQLIKLCDRSEWIALQVKRFPLLLDELLTPLYLQQQNTNIDESRTVYRDELRQQMLRIEPEDVEMVMDSWRQFRLCQQLRIAASDISGSLPIACVSDKLTALAEIILENVLLHAWSHTQNKYGKPTHLKEGEYGFMIVGYGKLGGYELGYGSDLDLVFIHNAPRDAVTDGKRQIGASQFYIKLAQRLMHLLNTKTLFGQLYETDLRLRPSGNAGLLCCHIDGFAKYQLEDAWTWEHQALVRARSITGDSELMAQFDQVRENVLRQPRDALQLCRDVREMRAKMREHLIASNANGIDLKQCHGGITDIEFLAQYWVLANANCLSELTKFTDNLRIIEMAAKHNLVTKEDTLTLQKAYLTLRDHYHQLTLADHRFADNSQVLASTRQAVTAIWDKTVNAEYATAPDH